jgi:hypothetical protein
MCCIISCLFPVLVDKDLGPSTLVLVDFKCLNLPKFVLLCNLTNVLWNPSLTYSWICSPSFVQNPFRWQKKLGLPNVITFIHSLLFKIYLLEDVHMLLRMDGITGAFWIFLSLLCIMIIILVSCLPLNSNFFHFLSSFVLSLS